jgi:hypothetical protein
MLLQNLLLAFCFLSQAHSNMQRAQLSDSQKARIEAIGDPEVKRDWNAPLPTEEEMRALLLKMDTPADLVDEVMEAQRQGPDPGDIERLIQGTEFMSKLRVSCHIGASCLPCV